MPLDRDKVAVIRAEYERLRLEVLERRRRGDLPAAIAKAKEALAYLEQQQDGLGYMFEAGNDLASLYGAVGDWASAEPVFERSLWIRERVCGPKDVDMATALVMLGMARYFLGKYADAEALIQAGLAVREEVLGAVHPHVALALTGLAAVYRATGRVAEGQELWDRAVRIGLPEEYTRQPS